MGCGIGDGEKVQRVTWTVPVPHERPLMDCPAELTAKLREKLNEPWPAPTARNSRVISTPEPLAPGTGPRLERPTTTVPVPGATWSVPPARRGPWVARTYCTRFAGYERSNATP